MSNSDVAENLRKLFLGGLKRSITEDDIRKKLEGYGNIVDLVVLRNRETQVSKGFGFVTFEQESSADAVLADRRQNGFEMADQAVEIKRAIPRDDQSDTAQLKVKKIFVGGIPRSVDESAARQYLTEWSAPDVPVKIDLAKKKEEPTQMRGFAFLEYENEDAVDRLIIKQGLVMNNKHVEVKKAAPREQMGELGARGGGGRGGNRGGNWGGSRGGGRGGFGGQQGYGGGSGGGGFGYNDNYNSGSGYRGGQYDNGAGYSGGYGGGDQSGGYGSGGFGGGYGSGGGGYGSGGGGYGSGGGGYGSGGGGYGSGGSGYGGDGSYGSGGGGGFGGSGYGGQGGGRQKRFQPY